MDKQQTTSELISELMKRIDSDYADNFIAFDALAFEIQTKAQDLAMGGLDD